MGAVSLVLCGFTQCGKTHCGRSVAARLQRSFFDTDLLIEEAYERLHGRRASCRALYRELGEVAFRALERDVIQALRPGVLCVIATGGGSLLDQENVFALMRLGRLVYLRTPKTTLMERIARGGWPAFVDAEDPLPSLERLMDARCAMYERLCLSVPTYGKTGEKIVDELCSIATHGQ